MAKASRRTVVQPIAEPLQADDGTAEIKDHEQETIAKIKAEFGQNGAGSDWKCSMFRVVQTGATGRDLKERWLFDCQPVELHTVRERIAGEFGAGRFRTRVLRDQKPTAQYDFEIELSPATARAFAERNRQQEAPATPALIAPAPTAANVPTTTDPALLAIVQQHGQMLERIAARLDAAPSGGSPAKQMLELMALMRELQPKGPDPAQMLDQVISLAEKMAKAGGGGGGSETGLLDLARDLIPAFTNALQTRGNGQAPAPVLSYPSPAAAPLSLPVHDARPANAPATPHAPAAPIAAAALDDATMAQLAAAGINVQQLAGVIAHCLDQARAGVQPNLVSEWVYERVPPVVFRFLEAQPDPVAALGQFFPDVNNYRAWFSALIESLYEPAEDAGAGEGDAAGHGAGVQQPSG